MCFNIVIINPNADPLAFNILFSSFLEKKRMNDDGYSIWTSNGVYLRTLKEEEFKEFLMEKRGEIKSAKVIHMHLRAASAGSVSQENIHMWKVGNYYVSHNGHFFGSYRVYSYYRYNRHEEGWYHYFGYNRVRVRVEEGKSDTLKFLEKKEVKKAIEKENWKELLKLIKKENGWGVFFLTSENKVIAIPEGKDIKVLKVNDLVVLSNDAVHLEDYEADDMFQTVFHYKLGKYARIDKPFVFSVKEMKVEYIEVERKKAKRKKKKKKKRKVQHYHLPEKPGGFIKCPKCGEYFGRCWECDTIFLMTEDTKMVYIPEPVNEWVVFCSRCGEDKVDAITLEEWL